MTQLHSHVVLIAASLKTHLSVAAWHTCIVYHRGRGLAPTAMASTLKNNKTNTLMGELHPATQAKHTKVQSNYKHTRCNCALHHSLEASTAAARHGRCSARHYRRMPSLDNAPFSSIYQRTHVQRLLADSAAAHRCCTSSSACMPASDTPTQLQPQQTLLAQQCRNSGQHRQC